MKKFQYAMFLLGFISAAGKAILNIYYGVPIQWYWTVITAMWILAAFFSFLHVNALEKKVKEYESK